MAKKQSYEEKLLRSIPPKRQIKLRGYITGGKVPWIKSKLKEFAKGQKRPVLVQINSKGGSFLHSLDIYHALKDSGLLTVGLVTKNASSGALLVLQACEVRLGYTDSQYRPHYPYASFRLLLHENMDKEQYMKAALEMADFTYDEFAPEVRAWRTEVHKILLEQVRKAGKSDKALRRLNREDRVLSAKEALAWGFIDEIVDAKG